MSSPPPRQQTKPCPYCAEQILAVAQKCRFCGEYLDKELRRKAAVEHAPDSVEKMLLPVGRSGAAIAAGYLGLLSLLPIFGIFAVITGYIALQQLKRQPELSGSGRAWFGIIMGVPTTLLYGFAFFAAALN